MSTSLEVQLPARNSPAPMVPFGPGSAVYDKLGDAAIVYAFVPSIIWTLVVPEGAQGVRDHDRLFDGRIDPIGIDHALARLVDTVDLIGGIVYGKQERGHIAHAVRELHRPVHGALPDGTRYHAWNKDTWSTVWGGILKGFVDTYGDLHGYRSDVERDDYYRGLVEMGSQFGVRSLPDTWAEFTTYWEAKVAARLRPTEEAAFLITLLTGAVPKPSFAPWIPQFAWSILSLPVRRVLRVGLLISIPETLDAGLGINRTWIDRIERRVHQIAWRLAPRFVTRRAGPAYFAIRTRGNPAWRTRYSPAMLEQRRRQAAANDRDEETPDQVPPSIST